MAKKLSAKQRRLRKAAERKEREGYNAGRIPAGKNSKKMRAETREKEREKHAARLRSAADTAKLNKEQLAADIMRLWDEAYKKYRRLMEQGTPNAATAIYEQNFAGMNPYENSMNVNRAIAAQLKNWLRRKDTSATRAKKAQRKTLKYLKKHGFPNIKQEDLEKFFELYNKYLEYTGGTPQGVKKYLEHFANSYEKYKEDPDGNMEEILEEAKRKMYEEYEDTFDPASFSSNPLDI